jgi:hypothetical protein
MGTVVLSACRAKIRPDRAINGPLVLYGTLDSGIQCNQRSGIIL